MKRKGFTLVELLAVIVILGIIGVIVFPTITKTMRNSKQKAYEEQINEIVRNAKIWGGKHTEELPEIGSEKSVCISLEVLQNEGLLAFGDIKDPRDEEKNIDGSIQITYSKEYHQYIYEYKENGC